MQHQHARLAGRLALVTGATRGIGRAVALAYAREGAHLILVGRTAGALEEVDDEIREAGGNATLLTLDLKNHDKIDALGPTIYQRWEQARHPRRQRRHPRAAVAPRPCHGGCLGRGDRGQPHRQLAPDPHARPAAAPLGRRPRHLRVLGRRCSPAAYWGPYAVSKAGLEALVKVYAHEVENTPVRVNLVNPGPTRTGMRAKAFPGETRLTQGARVVSRRSCAWPRPPAPTTAGCST